MRHSKLYCETHFACSVFLCDYDLFKFCVAPIFTTLLYVFTNFFTYVNLYFFALACQFIHLNVNKFILFILGFLDHPTFVLTG